MQNEGFRLSFSRAVTYLNCQHQYYRTYVVPPIVPLALSPSQWLGIVVHNGLYLYGKSSGKLRAPQEMFILEAPEEENNPGVVEPEWKSDKDKEDHYRQAKSVLLRYLDSAHSQVLLNSRDFELKITREFEGVTLSGVLDVLVDDNHIIDFKVVSPRSKTRWLKGVYSLQPLFYGSLIGHPYIFEVHAISKDDAEVNVIKRAVSQRELDFFHEKFLPNLIKSMQFSHETGVYMYTDPTNQLCSEYCPFWNNCSQGILKKSISEVSEDVPSF